MIVHTFERRQPLVIVEVTVIVNGKVKIFHFAVDTGATITLVSDDAMKKMGYRQAFSIFCLLLFIKVCKTIIMPNHTCHLKTFICRDCIA